jgi:mRNA interferase RelE/StbE
VKAKYRKKFLRDLAKIPSIDRKQIEKFAFEEVPALDSIADSGKIERLKGYKFITRFGLVLPCRTQVGT